MKKILALAANAAGMFMMMTAPAFAGTTDAINVPEPLSMSLLAGGIVAIAAVKRIRRK